MEKERRRRRNSSPSPIAASGEQVRGGLSPFSQRMQKQPAQNPSMMNMPPEYGPKKSEPGINADAPLPPGEVCPKMAYVIHPVFQHIKLFQLCIVIYF